jgi:ankyrin repeat protein
MPFVPGKKLDDFANDHITDAADMARLMLRVAEELHRLHVEAGLIHGDAGARNILVDNVDDDYNVHLLDFGMTYPADGYAIVNFEKPTSSDITSADMAHERYPNRKLKARPAQDVFTIAKTFRKLIKKRDTEWLDEFYARFPVIKNFIKMGLRKYLKNRPYLADFIENLESNLDWMVNLPKSVNKIAVTIESENWNRLKVLLKANNTPSEDLARLLHYLILNQKYEGTRHLIRYRKKIPAYSFFHGDTALHAAAASRDIDPAFFAELLAYIPKSDTVSAINLTNNAGDTVMHCAAESGCKDVVLELLKYHPDLSIRNDEGKTPIEAAQQSIMPVLEFIKYLQDLENQRETASPRMFSKSVRTKHHRLLDAARFVEECILTNNVDEDEYETFRGIIEDSPELSGHVQNLIHSEWLQTADSGFNLYSLLGF